MKKNAKIAALLVLGCTVLGTLGADPIGLTIGVDSFTFGNMLAEDYKFAGEGGQASITPDIEYAKAFGNFSVWAQVKVPISFAEKELIPLWLKAQPGYTFSIGENGKFDIIPLFQFGIPVANGEANEEAHEDEKKVAIDIIPQVKYTQTLGFGSLYINLPISISLNSGYYEKVTVIGTGASVPLPVMERDIGTIDSCDGLRLGVNTNAGVYGFTQFDMLFSASYDGTNLEDIDVLQQVRLRVGYNKLVGGNLDIYSTFYIPTIDDGIKYVGLAVDLRATYSNIVPGLKAYLDLNLGGLGKEGAKTTSFTPSIGVLYSF